MLALTVGDSDFRVPPPVQGAIEKRIAEGVLGYDTVPDSLIQVIKERLADRYNWHVQPDWLVFLPGVVQGLNLSCRALTKDGEAVIVESPVYYPFFDAPTNSQRAMKLLPAEMINNRWAFNLREFAALAADPLNALLLFCNPQNPLGRVSSERELRAMADICRREKVIIVSDEVHCDVVYDGRPHVPLAALDESIADMTVTLMGPSKTFAISGLGGAFAIIPNENLRQRFHTASAGLIPNLHVLAIAAMEAAYSECDEWCENERQYLESNRDFLVAALNNTPGVNLISPEGTYFLWLDFSPSGLNDPYGTLLEAGVELSPGGKFGNDQYLRLNFASPRSQLEQAVSRILSKLSP